MKSERVSFENSDGHVLSARVDLPVDRHAHNYVLFAHCFTCSKDLNAVRNISRSLTLQGFGVFRFDFTGLGNSSGEFENTNFSSNLEDLVLAADFMRTSYSAPSILVGHSLGGAAVIAVANRIPEVEAVATIGAPSSPDHVITAFDGHVEEIENSGGAIVELAGRPFKVKKQLLTDLRTTSVRDTIRDLKQSLLIMHSPQDETVGIENAREIYDAAMHPKSFLSLDGADHLLTTSRDSLYVGDVLASWSKRYVEVPSPEPIKTDHQVVARLEDEDGYTTEIRVGPHYLVADEPKEVGGNDFGPNPYEFVSSGLAACTAMTMKMYARRKNWPLDSVEVHVSHNKKHCDDCENVADTKVQIDHFNRAVTINGNLDIKQRDRLLEIANKCPVHKTLHQNVVVKTTLLGE